MNNQTTEVELVKLNRVELSELSKHEQTIKDGLHTFIEVGNALLNIRDKRLYRADHDTFEDYCRKRWGMSKTHANRLIASASVATNVQSDGGVVPLNESQIRPLTKLDPATQMKVWGQVVKKTHVPGEITAALVREAVERVTGKPAIERQKQPKASKADELISRARVLDELSIWWGKNSTRLRRAKPEAVFIALKKVVSHGL